MIHGRTLNDNKYVASVKDSVALRLLMDNFVKSWETADRTHMDEYIKEDAYINFDIFNNEMTRNELEESLCVRTKTCTFTRFDIFGYVCRFKGNEAALHCEIVGEFGNSSGEKYAHFGFTGLLSCSAIKESGLWKFNELRFMLQDDEAYRWPKLETNGIPRIKDTVSDDGFVKNWKLFYDKVGWFSDTKIPSITGEFDAPWYKIPVSDYVGTDEEQIEETMYRYFYGLDQNVFDTYISTFSPDCAVSYDDAAPYTRRWLIRYLKGERQGSPRCVHTGKFTKIEVNGDRAYAELFVHSTRAYDPYKFDAAEEERRLAWARYRLKFEKINGKWFIYRLNYYPAWFVAEEA